VNQFTASLWGDEAWAATLAVKPYLQIIGIVSKDTSPPLYYLLLHTWMKFFGTSEVAIRSLSFLFFSGTVLNVFFIGKHFWDKKTGFLAAILTLLNPFLFNYAFEGRMYSLLVLTSTLSLYFFLKKNRLGFIFSTTAALYTHHFSIFIVIFEGLWRLTESLNKPPRQILKNLSDFVVIGILYIPWLYPLYYQTRLVGSGFWLGRPVAKDLAETIFKFLVGSGQESIRQLALSLVIIVLLLRKWSRNIKESAFLMGCFFTPLVLTFLISQVFQPIFYDRYMLVAIPAGCLILASNRRPLCLSLIAILLVCLVSLDFYYFTHPTKRPFRQLADYVKTQMPDATLINYNGAAHHLWEAKYYGLNAPIYSPSAMPFYTGTALMEKGDVLKSLPDKSKIVAITSENPENIGFPGYVRGEIVKFDGLSLVEFYKLTVRQAWGK
jgi:hypothetical protein